MATTRTTTRKTTARKTAPKTTPKAAPKARVATARQSAAAARKTVEERIALAEKRAAEAEKDMLAQVRKSAVEASTPLYAAVGVTDLAVERLREGRLALERELEPKALQAKATKRVKDTVTQVQNIPAHMLNRTLQDTAAVHEGYIALVKRGESLVERIKGQQATKDLIAQAESTVARGKGAVTTARKAVDEVERSAKSTLTLGRREAMGTASTIAGSVVEAVVEEAEEAVETVKASSKRTTAAAKRTGTTTRKAATRASAGAKGAATSARKTAAASTKATKKAAEKVGD
ncbi:hypothetical protein ACQP1U_15685 [Actinomycetota bacterium]